MTANSKPSRFPLLAASLLGLTGVALGAMGAHALRAELTERGMTQAWETGARYHLFHAVALLGVAAWAAAKPLAKSTRALLWAARGWVVGVVLFSGSLYGLALGGPRWLGPVTPLGGIFLILGWFAVLLAALARDE